MKIRLILGRLNPYINNGGSWDEAKPNLGSFEVEVASTPVSGQFIMCSDPTNENKLTIAMVNEVVFLHSALVYMFATKGNVIQ